MNARLLLILLLTGLLLPGCDAANSGRGMVTGPDPLDGPEHMNAYLAGAPSWMLWYQPEVPQFWKFNASGTFTAWMEDDSPKQLADLFAGHIPTGVPAISGMWQADENELRLSEIRAADGQLIDDFTLPLGWVDGKLRIEIGGHHYMRQMRSGTP